MSIVLVGSTSGSITLQEPAVAGSTVLTLPATTGTVLTSASPSSDLPISINGPAFSAWASSAQTLSSGVLTKINFDTEIFDTNSNFASSRFTPTVAGYYQINSNIVVGSTATRVYLVIYKNGSAYNQGADPSGSTNIFANSVSSLIYCNGSTDYIEIYGFFGTGQGVFANSVGTWFNGSMVRGA